MMLSLTHPSPSQLIKEINMTLISQLPQELLLAISEYGSIHPSLDLKYIINHINNIYPNYPWHQEFILEYHRIHDEGYQLYKDLFSLIPLRHLRQLSIAYSAEDDNIYIPLMECSLSPIYYRDMTSLPSDLLNDIIDQARIISHEAKYDEGYLIVPNTLNLSYSQLHRVIYLIHCRTKPEGEELDRVYFVHPKLVDEVELIPEDDMTDDEDIYTNQSIDEHEDIDIISDMYSSSRSTLREMFPDIFSDDTLIDDELILKEILGMHSMNRSQYNIGELLRWLKNARDNMTIAKSVEIYGLIRDLGVTSVKMTSYSSDDTTYDLSIDACSYHLEITLSNESNMELMSQSLRQLGLRTNNYIYMRSITIDIKSSQSELVDIVRRLYSNMLLVRSCINPYSCQIQ